MALTLEDIVVGKVRNGAHERGVTRTLVLLPSTILALYQHYISFKPGGLSKNDDVRRYSCTESSVFR